MHRIFSDPYLLHHIALLAAAADQFEVVHLLLCTFRKYHNFVQREALEQLRAACIRNKPFYKELYRGVLPNGMRHSVCDLPAIVTECGDRFWYLAVEHELRAKEWYHNGRRHRDNDLPAIEYTDGGKEWWKHGERHRDKDRPAIVWANGDKEWWKGGRRHRDNDLPAVEWVGGHKEWWKNGKWRRQETVS